MLPGVVGILGTALVQRSAVLAYFHDPETVEVNGHSYDVHGYHEHECIIDPAAVNRVKYEHVVKVEH
jgi:hypothetical protein